MFEYQDTLQELNDNATLMVKLASVHKVVRDQFNFIDRIAVAIHDRETDLLKTFIHSSGTENPLSHYQSKLSEAASLMEIVARRRPRVVNDLAVFRHGQREHTQRIKEHGYVSSYTMPMYLDGTFFGFVFFNSFERDAFREEVLHTLDVFGHLLSLVVINELTTFRTLVSTLKAARNLTYHRDMETGTHLDRMSNYARLMARELAETHGLDDEYIEKVFLFSPLHDIGKIAVPDAILKKPGKLTAAEYEVMKTHATKGRQIVDELVRDFGFDSVRNVEMLRNIAELHHETLDGTGYPHGLKADQIPIEARIVAVADIFDALTSRRPYKEAWSNERAFDMLRRLAKCKLDPGCVEALIKNAEEIVAIQRHFAEDEIG